MTQIFYDGRHLLADRKCYRENGGVFSAKKVKQVVHNGEIWTWAFSGDFVACLWGDKVVQSGLDPKVIEQARQAIPEGEQDLFTGILVKVPANPELFNQRQAFNITPLGDLIELNQSGPYAVGALHDAVLSAFRMGLQIDAALEGRVSKLLHLAGLTEEPQTLAEFAIRTATRDTIYNQTDYVIDVIDLKPVG